MGVEGSASPGMKIPRAEGNLPPEYWAKNEPLVDAEVCSMEKGEGESTAAVTVQKLYRGYRTRRHLADTAVMTRKYAWWNVLEGAILRQNSEQFYAYNKPETATTRWLRLKQKAAKVGRGLSKDERARKLALQHWLEAIDARHRYGHNLNLYYDVWLKSQTHEPFFYWLNVGEGREVDLMECPREKLQKEQIKYLGPKERKQYEVIVEGGKLVYKQTGEFVHTPKGDKWIFVMSTAGKLYVAKKAKGKFQHSSFLAGSATTAAGRLLVNNGVLELMEAYSGHYHPTEENFKMLVDILTKNGADLTMVQVQSVSEDVLPSHLHQPSFVKEEEFLESAEAPDLLTVSDKLLVAGDDGKAVLKQDSIAFDLLSETKVQAKEHTVKGIANLDIFDKALNIFDNECNREGIHIEAVPPKSLIDVSRTDGDEALETSSKSQALCEENKPVEVTTPGKKQMGSEVPLCQAKIGINKQPSFSWSSGAGARLSSLSELPPDVRSKALEFVRQNSRVQVTP